MSLETFLQALSPATAPPQESPSIVEAQVHDVTAAGMRFTIRDWDNGKHVFGPAPWPMTQTIPTKGARALVVFVGGGIDRPWVLGWWAA